MLMPTQKRDTERRGVPEMMGVNTVCKALDISRRTLYRRPYRYSQDKPGGKRLYFADDIRLALLLNTIDPRNQ